MINKIFTDLKDNIRSIYQSNQITLPKFLHHSLNYEDPQVFFKKYNTNIGLLKQDLMSHIQNYEIDIEKNEEKIEDPFEQFEKHFFSMGFGEVSIKTINNPKIKSNRITISADLSNVFDLALRIEQTKLINQMKITGEQPPALDDISFESFISAMISYLKTKNNQKYILNFLNNSGFDVKKFESDEARKQKGEKNVLDELCTNLNAKVKEGKISDVIGRDDEIDQLINVLSKTRKNNPVLLGKAGTGKTAIVEGLAKRIVEGNVPEQLKKAVIYNLEIVNMVKDTSFRGQFEKNVSQLLKQFQEMDKSGEIIPILFIDELHTIMGAGSSGNGGLDFSNIIKPALARGELRTIGATTTEEWYKFINDNAALKRRFYSITINEPNFENAVKMIKQSLGFYEKSHGVSYLQDTVERSVELTSQFVIDNALPDKAFDLIDFAGAMNKIKGKKEVSVDDIEYALAKHKNIDLDSIRSMKKNEIKPFAPLLKKIIFGQDHAVEKVAKTIQKSLAGLNMPEKPFGVFLFNGPTGTGKTELAKQVAKTMNANFHRIDCSELGESHSVSKILGSPAGYVGYDDGSSLTKIINENPRTVLLLDEFDKTHHDIQKIFLQAMDYGKLTDSKGHEINFKNVLMIMTSNFKTSTTKQLGLSTNSDSKKLDYEWNNKLLPEFRARLTGNSPIEFNSLTTDVYEKLVDKVILELNEQRMVKKNIQLAITENAKKYMVVHAQTINLGARPIYDIVEDKIVEPLVDEILFGNYKNQKELVEITIDCLNNELFFVK